MVKLIEFEELHLPITWNLIDIGFKSDTVFRDELLASDIVEYAISLLAFDDSNLVLELAAEDKRDTEQIDKYVKKLASQENVEREEEYEKWIICYVNHHIQKKYDDEFEGLIELGDIWAKMDMLEEYSRIFDGLGFSFHEWTYEKYEKLYQAHHDWVKNRLSKIVHS